MMLISPTIPTVRKMLASDTSDLWPGEGCVRSHTHDMNKCADGFEAPCEVELSKACRSTSRGRDFSGMVSRFVGGWPGPSGLQVERREGCAQGKGREERKGKDR